MWHRRNGQRTRRARFPANPACRAALPYAQVMVCVPYPGDAAPHLRASRTAAGVRVTLASREAFEIQRRAVELAERRIQSTRLKLDAGRSTTSPAAIWLATWSGRMRMRAMV